MKSQLKYNESKRVLHLVIVHTLFYLTHFMNSIADVQKKDRLQRCRFKRRECIIQPLRCTGGEHLHEHQGYYQHMWRVERSADQSQSKKRKEKSLREERMQRDTGGHAASGCTACKTAMKMQEVCEHFLKITAEDKEIQSDFHATITRHHFWNEESIQ